jgi:hypothetical protein
MLGCMIESGLGIAAAAQIASLCDHVDLDGNLLLGARSLAGVAFLDGIPGSRRRARTRCQRRST